jgi:SM-20-related protein
MSTEDDSELAVGPLPPVAVIDDFLDPATRRALFDFALSRETQFRAAEVVVGGDEQVDPTRRINRRIRKLGPIEADLSTCFLRALPSIQSAIGGRVMIDPALELEVTAYSDGAFFTPHLDIPVGVGRRPFSAYDNQDRVISAIYYFHATPKLFEGGDLRLYRFGMDPDRAEPGDVRDIEPVDNRLVAFPSWALHEVRPVRSSSERFADSRFALNCWYCAP